MATPSTLTGSVNDMGIAGVLNGLFKTGIQFLGDNLFGGDKEDELTAVRKINAQQTELLAQRAATPPVLRQVLPPALVNQGIGITPGLLVAGVGFTVIVLVFLRVR